MSRYLIEIGVDNLELTIYVGEEGKELFLDKIKEVNNSGQFKVILDKDDLECGQGLHFLNFIWVENWERRVLLHELQHYIDNLFDELAIHNEPESKAIFMSNTIEKVLEIRDKENK